VDNFVDMCIKDTDHHDLYLLDMSKIICVYGTTIN
jgi:hypothetical protein